MGLELKFEITLASDYHIGAGFGNGALVDSALARDADGIPSIRGTVLTGLLRDALWRLLQMPPLHAQRKCARTNNELEKPEYCGRTDENAILCALCRVFGTPRQPKAWQFSSARPALLETIGGRGNPERGSQIVQRARVSPRLRRAEARKLFSQEEGDSQFTFSFHATTRHDGEAALDEAALIVAAARNLRELGRGRRRGRGECRVCLVAPITLDGIELNAGENLQTALLRRFKTRWVETDAGALTQITRTKIATRSVDTQAQPIRLRILLRTDEPLLIAERAEAGNQFETILSINGSTLRGALAQRAAAQLDLEDETTYTNFENLFWRAQIRFSALLPTFRPAGEKVYAMIPAPMDLRTCKLYPVWSELPENRAHDRIVLHQAPAADKCSKCDSDLVSVDGFLPLRAAAKAQTHAPDTRVEMHNQISPNTQRAQDAALYSYVALEAGQYFWGELVCDNEILWTQLQELTDLKEKETCMLRLGKATRRGYGGVTVWLERQTDSANDWIGQPFEARVDKTKAPSGLVVNLLTDTILMDRFGRYQLGFTDQALAQALGLAKDAVKIHHQWATTREVDGFNAHLGLPRARDIALRAASVVLFDIVNPPKDWHAQLAKAERAGIGLRRAEGFGRIAFNHPIYTEPASVAASIDVLPLGTPSDEHFTQVEAEQMQAWQEQLESLSLRDMNEKGCTRFGALAAWLYAERARALDDLIQRLTAQGTDELGTPSQSLQSHIDDYGKPSKDNYFDIDGNENRAVVVNFLNQLGARDSKFHARGVAMLAERIAEQVDTARQAKSRESETQK